MSRAFGRYLRDIGTHPVLSREEEAALARRSREGDAAARERLVSANLRFVIAVAKKYRDRGVPLADLVNEGNLGLIKAAGRFDETRGVRFVSYAVWWIRQAMLQAIARENDASRAERSYRLVSIDQPLNESGPASLADIVPDEDRDPPEKRIDRHALRDALDSSLTRLPEREERVIRMYYGLDGQEALTLSEVGDRLGVTRERARQIKDRGLSRLRSGARRKSLEAHRE